MATTTAFLMVGTAHQNHGGIGITDRIYLSENSRPALILKNEDSIKPKMVWIPTVEYMIDDAMLMVGIYLIKNQKLVDRFTELTEGKKVDREELYRLFSEEERQELYQLNQETIKDFNVKVVVTALDGTTILGQLKHLHSYEIDMEVCKTIYSRELSSWTGKVNVRGEL